MQLKLKVKLSVTLFAKQTLNKLDIDKVIEEVYNDDSEEYKQVVMEYENYTGKKRDDNVDKFDKELLEYMANTIKQTQSKKVAEIAMAIKECYCLGKNAYFELGGYIINVADFSCIRINTLEFECSKH